MDADLSYQQASSLTWRTIREAEGPGRKSVRDQMRAMRYQGRKEGVEDNAHTSPWTKRPLAERRQDRRRRNASAKRARRVNR